MCLKVIEDTKEFLSEFIPSSVLVEQLSKTKALISGIYLLLCVNSHH